MSSGPDKGYLKDPNTRQTVVGALKSGAFTPFLGAGASSLRSPRLEFTEVPWKQIRNALLLIRDFLRRQTPPSAEAYLYLRSFTEQRLRISGDELNQMFPVNETTQEPAWDTEATDSAEAEQWPSSGLLQFQCLIVQVAAELGKIFGYAFATAPSVLQVAECRVQLKITEMSYPSRVVIPLLQLIEQTRSLDPNSAPRFDRRIGRYRPPALKLEDIRKKLLLLTSELTDSTIWQLDELSTRKPPGIAEVWAPLTSAGMSNRHVDLKLNRLQWLSDLLWYSLRYWVPRYPTTAELAFELSLAAEFGLPRRAELAQAAEALFWDNNQLASSLSPLLLFCQKAQPYPMDFHLAIAAALMYMYLEYREKLRSRGAGEGRVRAFVPLALTTNFDRAIEATFDYLNHSYHVVYPLADPERQSQVNWYVKTVISGGAKDPEPEPFENPLENEDLKGPVIVKLHGSPLDPVPDGLEHWLVLSESGYLEAMDPELTTVPKWLVGQLKKVIVDPRSLWFLGYSVADWNIRLRLYRDLSYYREPTGTPLKSVVERGSGMDWFREAIFGRLKVKLIEGDLVDMPSILRESLRASGVERRPEIEEILNMLDVQEGD